MLHIGLRGRRRLGVFVEWPCARLEQRRKRRFAADPLRGCAIAMVAAAAGLLCTSVRADTCLCPGDLDADRTVGAADLGILLGEWNQMPPPRIAPCLSPDIDQDGTVDGIDLGILLANWGPCPAATGGCCSSAGCKPLTLEECDILGGTYLGDGIECGPTGPCCFTDGSCEELAEGCCAAAAGFFAGAGTTCALAGCAMVDLDVDTDRDGDIHDVDDEAGEDAWTKARGAFYLVNCNDSDGLVDEDGLRFDATESPVAEDFFIDGVGDENDITPFVVRATGPLQAGSKVFLEAPLAEIRAVHVFDDRDAGSLSLWGGPTETETRYQINAAVDPDDPSELGLEGLYFRFVQPGHPMEFDGYLNLTLLIENATGNVVGKDTVRLKVAPYIALPNTQDAQSIFARNSTLVPLFPNAAFLGDLNVALPGLVETFDTDTQWAQDPLETGYSETSTSFMWVTAHTLHQGQLPGGDVQWARDLLLDESKGLYRNPAGPTSDSGDFGGNIEVLPPTTNHKLGRFAIGNTISAWKRAFLESQEVQPPILMTAPYPAGTLLDTKWLEVGHVDEMVGFIEKGPHKVVIASPRRAYKILGAPFGGLAGGSEDSEGGIDEPAEDDELFFADGATTPAITISAVSGPLGYTILVPGVDFTGQSWQYLHVFDYGPDPSHPAIGQTAHVSQLGDGFIVVDAVQASFDIDLTTGGSGTNCAGGLCTLGYNPPTTTEGWFAVPPPSAQIVLAEGTRFWPTNSVLAAAAPGFPAASAMVTVKETRANAKLRALNLKCQARLDAVKDAITAAMMGDPVTFVEVPVIFTTSKPLDMMGEIMPRSVCAWNPGLANVVVAGGKLVFPKQFGPKKAGVDRFEKAVTDSLGATVRFVDDWDNYHTQMGEVHCGTNALRDPYPDPWWDNQP